MCVGSKYKIENGFEDLLRDKKKKNSVGKQ